MSELDAGPFRRRLTLELDLQNVSETEFEKPRGVSGVEVRRGFLSAKIDLPEPDANAQRLRALAAVADAGISLDFLKLTPGGFSFLTPQAAEGAVRHTLQALGSPFRLKPSRCVVLVHAVNMRDEEGLIARVSGAAVASGAEIDHIGDMHDRVLLVADETEADRLVSLLTETLGVRQGATAP